jgi:hypothetical protein
MGTKKGDKTITPRGGRVIVTEDKCTAAMSESKARKILQEAMDNRSADLGMLIVEDESKVPGKQPFHFIDDNKVVVVADRWALRLVYAFMRARSIEIATTIASVDDAELLSTVRTVHALAKKVSGGRSISSSSSGPSTRRRPTRSPRQAGMSMRWPPPSRRR